MNWDQLRTAIRAVLLADATFLTYLATAESVYESEPGIALEDGMVTIALTDEGQDDEADITGKFRPRIQINLYKVSVTTLWAMRARLGTLLEIPRQRTTIITTASHEIRTAFCFNTLDLGKVKQLQNDSFLRHVATEWRLRVVTL